jgi:hypothetical protein
LFANLASDGLIWGDFVLYHTSHTMLLYLWTIKYLNDITALNAARQSWLKYFFVPTLLTSHPISSCFEIEMPGICGFRGALEPGSALSRGPNFHDTDTDTDTNTNTEHLRHSSL